MRWSGFRNDWQVLPLATEGARSRAELRPIPTAPVHEPVVQRRCFNQLSITKSLVKVGGNLGVIRRLWRGSIPGIEPPVCELSVRSFPVKPSSAAISDTHRCTPVLFERRELCFFVELGGIASVAIEFLIGPGRRLFRPGGRELVVQPVVQPTGRVRAIPRSHSTELGTDSSVRQWSYGESGRHVPGADSGWAPTAKDATWGVTGGVTDLAGSAERFR